jgi:hypothetical protein
MVETFTLIAQERQHPLSMTRKVASPGMIQKLLRLLIGASPKVKVIVLKIFQNLVNLQLPNELFCEAVNALTKNEQSLAAKILNANSKLKFADSVFLQFMVNYQ